MPKKAKPYWEMTTAELREATKEFDEEFVADKFRPLTPKMRAQWKRACAKNATGNQVISVKLRSTLLDRCRILAEKKRVTFDELVARGLKAILAAEGET